MMPAAGPSPIRQTGWVPRINNHFLRPPAPTKAGICSPRLSLPKVRGGVRGKGEEGGWHRRGVSFSSPLPALPTALTLG